MKKNKKLEKLLQQFYDVGITDPVLVDVGNRYSASYNEETGFFDESILEEGYDHLDKKFNDSLKQEFNKYKETAKKQKKVLKED